MVGPMMTFVRILFMRVVFVRQNGQFFVLTVLNGFFLKKKKRKSGYYVCKQCIQDSIFLPPKGEEEIFQS